MAEKEEKAATDEKLVLKPGTILQFLDNFSPTPDGASMQFADLNMSNKRVEALAKAADEIKDV